MQCLISVFDHWGEGGGDFLITEEKGKWSDSGTKLQNNQGRSDRTPYPPPIWGGARRHQEAQKWLFPFF